MIRAISPRNREKRHTVCTIATAREHVFDALRLVQEEYLRTGLTLTNRSGVRVTQYHLVPTTEILVGLVEDEVACTASLVRDSHVGLPLEAIYGSHVTEYRQTGKRLAEASCLANRRDDAEETLTLVFRLMALVIQLANARQVDELLIAVHPRHSRFYERFLGFRHIGGLKYYSTVCGNPAVAMALDVPNLHQTNPKAYKRVFGRPFPADALKPRGLEPEVFDELHDIYLQDEEANRRFLNPDRVAEQPTSNVESPSTALVPV